MKRKIEGRVYSLKNPLDNNSIFYVGQTVYSMQDRLKAHIRESKSIVSRKNDIIRKIIENGETVIIEEIEYFSGNSFKDFEQQMNDREKFWIRSYTNLCNIDYDSLIKNCDYCKVSFEAKTNRARFCSDICRASFHQKENTGNGDATVKVKAEQVKFVNVLNPQIKTGKQLFDFLYEEYCKLYRAEKKSVFATNEPAVYDSPHLPVTTHDEPKQWQEVDNTLVWKRKVDECESIEEMDYIGQAVVASGLTRHEQNVIQKYGKMICERKGFI